MNFVGTALLIMRYTLRIHKFAMTGDLSMFGNFSPWQIKKKSNSYLNPSEQSQAERKWTRYRLSHMRLEVSLSSHGIDHTTQDIRRKKHSKSYSLLYYFHSFFKGRFLMHFFFPDALLIGILIKKRNYQADGLYKRSRSYAEVQRWRSRWPIVHINVSATSRFSFMSPRTEYRSAIEFINECLKKKSNFERHFYGMKLVEARESTKHQLQFNKFSLPLYSTQLTNDPPHPTYLPKIKSKFIIDTNYDCSVHREFIFWKYGNTFSQFGEQNLRFEKFVWRGIMCHISQ